MLSTTPHAASFAAAMLLLGSLGLGGCSTSSNAIITHTAALNTSGGRDTARSSVQSAILIADTTNGIALPGGPTPASIARRVFGMIHRGRSTLATGTSTGACSNGVKSSAVTNADGSRTTTTDYYYEAACVTLEVEESISLATPATPGNTDGTGTITSYDHSGAVRVVEQLILTVGTSQAEETLTMTGTAASTATGTTTSGLGATCVGTPPSATVTCSAAHWGTSVGTISPGTITGEAIGTTATAGASGGNANATVSISFFAATSLGIAQASGTTTWGVSGTTAFNSATGTYGYATTGSSGAGTLTFKDVLYTYTETATLTATGLSVTIVENPNGIVTVDTPIATATIDVAGNGVLTYADGTTEPIAAGLLDY
jgi:hypothetical protein